MAATFDMEVRGFRDWVADLLRDVDVRLQPKVIRAITKQAIEMLIEATPKDTGRAASGWVGFAVINGKRETIRGRSFRLAAESPGDRGTFELTTDRRFSSHAILANGVPYIMALEFGHSKQAPNGMLRITFTRLQAERVFSKTLQKELERSVRRTNGRHAGRAIRVR